MGSNIRSVHILANIAPEIINLSLGSSKGCRFNSDLDVVIYNYSEIKALGNIKFHLNADCHLEIVEEERNMSLSIFIYFVIKRNNVS